MKNLKKLAKKLLKIKDKEVTRSCSNCEKYGSMRCPNSFYCYSIEKQTVF